MRREGDCLRSVVGRGRPTWRSRRGVDDEQHLHAGAPADTMSKLGARCLGGGQVLLARDALQGDSLDPRSVATPRLNLLGIAHFLLLPLYQPAQRSRRPRG